MEDFYIIDNIISKDLAKFTTLEFEMQETACHALYPNGQLDDVCENTFARYSPLMMEALMVTVQPRIEEVLGAKIIPVYSYARIYYNNTCLDKHYDKPSSEISVSICLEKDVPWPLIVEDRNGQAHEFDLEECQAIVYCGRDQKHWRNPNPGKKQVQCFLQYVFAEGKDAWRKFDTRPCLGLPFEYASQAVQEESKKFFYKL
jgi:hypothetical protein